MKGVENFRGIFSTTNSILSLHPSLHSVIIAVVLLRLFLFSFICCVLLIPSIRCSVAGRLLMLRVPYWQPEVPLSCYCYDFRNRPRSHPKLTSRAGVSSKPKDHHWIRII
ncbi:hypothetical protein N658DRAFT_52104 [Parathielavia hyrcaniae]|uniref:Uncharacterized protein n=1 Tax=Parathielavia hyrcaniae TaxID=113614 RepID=A0AAN6Q633_9PEZI|nr:hypothetical protein N658DRAFT_52104 [Parathielavia hyrcaniae]